jgi:hypothetical protein
MPLNTKSFVWPSQGIDPREIATASDAVYRSGEQPIASYDNFVNRMITEDIQAIEQFSNNHASEHEADGPQEIDLDGLSVGGGATVAYDESSEELRWLDDDGEPVYRLDVPDERIRQMPGLSTLLDARRGVATGDDLERTDGDVIYDHDDDYFHRARHADSAAWADEAGSLAGFDGSDYVKKGDDVTITGEWKFTQPIKGDLDGRAAEADWAETAAHADHADTSDHATFADEAAYATEAHNAQYLRGMSPADIIEEAGGDGSGGGGGGWFNIDIDISIDISTKINFSKNFSKSFTLKSGKKISGPFDQCKLRIYHESSASFSSSKSYMKMHINNEKRSRYNYSKSVTSSTQTTKSIQKVSSNWAWPVAHTNPQEFSVTEYDISAPSSIGNIDRHYPKITAVSNGVSEDMSGVLTEGTVETNYDKIDAIDLESRAEGAARVEYWVRNFEN